MNNKNKYQTKYTFTGSKVENKYANIYEDLNQKEELYSTNSLKKIHPDENVEEKKPVLREISVDEAKENSQKRRKLLKHEKELAMRRSSPIVASKKYPSIDLDGNIKSLQDEKFDEINIDENFDIEEFLKNNKDAAKEEMFSDPDYIHKKAKERAKMDKTGVEIYKEYSDFDTSVNYAEESKIKGGSNDALKNDMFDGVENTIDLSNEVEEIIDPTQYSLRHKTVKGEDDIRDKEEEIEELLKRIKGNEKKDRTDRARSQKTQKAVRNSVKKAQTNTNSKDESLSENRAFKNRADVYKRNNKSRESRISFKKLFATLVVIIVVIFIGATAYNYYNSNVAKNDNKSTVQTQSKNDTKSNSKTVDVKAKKEENIRKLEALKSKLNSTEVDRLDYIIKNIDSYPEAMISLLIRNSETVDYVYSYKDRDSYNSRDLSNVTSSYQVDGDVPLFLQWDRRWGYRMYGNEELGLSGCGPTSLAMVIKHFNPKDNVNPYSVAEYSSKNGYVSNKNSTSWSLFEKGITSFGLRSFDVVPVEAKMKKALDDGNLLIVSVKQGIFTEVGHIFVIRGYDSEGNFLINDPNSIQNSNKAWSFDELKSEIRKIWAIGEIESNNTSSSNSSNTESNTQSASDTSDDPSIIQDIE